MDAFVRGLIDAVNGVLWNDVLIALLLGMVMFGSVGQLPLVWAMADTSMGLMAIINLIAILVLGKYAHAVWRDYRCQRADGIADPVFTRHTIPELERVLPADVWGEHGPLPQRAAAAASDAEAASGVAVRRS